MRVAVPTVLIIAGLLFLATHRIEPSFTQTHMAPSLSAVEFRDLGPMEKIGKYAAPSYETECIRATGECWKIQHPLLNPKAATVCWDAVERQYVRYTEADRFCHA